MNSLFLSEVYNTDHPGPSKRQRKTTCVQSHTVILKVISKVTKHFLPFKENGVYLKLNLIDTPGFGDCIDNTNCWQPVLDYIISRFDDYISGESRVNRPCQSIPDQRIHACIYFIAPTGKFVMPNVHKIIMLFI